MYPYAFYTQETRTFATKIKVCKKNHLLEGSEKYLPEKILFLKDK